MVVKKDWGGRKVVGKVVLELCELYCDRSMGGTVWAVSMLCLDATI